MSTDHASQAERNARFDYLIDAYLDYRATEAEKEELRAMVEAGYGERFKQRFDEDAEKKFGGLDIKPETREEILMNIFDRKPVKQKGLRVWYYAAAALVVCGLSVSVFLLSRENQLVNKDIQTATRLQPVKTGAEFKGRQYIELPDGSTAILNDNSSLSYEKDFNNALREVVLTGEAFFDVAHNPSKPFRVRTGKVVTTVLGTAFNVKAFPGQTEVKVTVARGKVQVGDDTHIFGLLTPDQQIAVNTETLEFKQTTEKSVAVTEWKSNFIILDRISMEAATAILEDRYGVKFFFENNDAMDCIITASFLHDESLEQILNVIGTVLQIEYQFLPDGNIKLIGSCK